MRRRPETVPRARVPLQLRVGRALAAFVVVGDDGGGGGVADCGGGGDRLSPLRRWSPLLPLLLFAPYSLVLTLCFSMRHCPRPPPRRFLLLRLLHLLLPLLRLLLLLLLRPKL